MPSPHHHYPNQRRGVPMSESESKPGKWEPWDDEQLAMSWLYVIKDPIGSKSSWPDMWQRITDHFNSRTTGSRRGFKSITERWKKINTELYRFTNVYNSIKSDCTSDLKPVEWLERTKNNYHEITGRYFIFESAWNIVKDRPEWREEFDRRGSSANINGAGGGSSSSTGINRSPQKLDGSTPISASRNSAAIVTPIRNGSESIRKKGEKILSSDKHKQSPIVKEVNNNRSHSNQILVDNETSEEDEGGGGGGGEKRQNQDRPNLQITEKQSSKKRKLDKAQDEENEINEDRGELEDDDEEREDGGEDEGDVKTNPGFLTDSMNLNDEGTGANSMIESKRLELEIRVKEWEIIEKEMKIISRDLESCVDHFEKEYFIKLKQKILKNFQEREEEKKIKIEESKKNKA